MDDIQAFYDAVSRGPRRQSTYCDQFPLDDLPDDARNLLHLLYSMVMVSFPVECWGQQRVPDSGPAYLDLLSRARALNPGRPYSDSYSTTSVGLHGRL